MEHMNKISKSIELAGKTLTLDTGEVAFQATSAVLGRLGDTMVLVTVVSGGKRPDLDYFPLSVDYVERLYAGGRIKGSRWVKREGRPSDEAILNGRLIDRSIRPLFPKDFLSEVQVVVTVLSVDGENDPDILSLITTSAALSISPVPWNGPIASVRIGMVAAASDAGAADFLVNPTTAQKELSDLDLVVSNGKGKTVMIETGAREVPEDIFLAAVEKSHEETARLIEFIEAFVKEAGTKKASYEKNEFAAQLLAKIEQTYKKEVDDLVAKRAENEGGAPAVETLAETIAKHEEGSEKAQIIKVLDYLFKKNVRKSILEKGKRVDGRKNTEIRPISSSVSVLPRTHGSAIFQRGQTQALSVVTLGAPSLEQLIESAEGEDTKRYIHHYAFPPYSVGETGRVGFLSRREIGHGALAERAVEPVIPKEDTFPYTIRVVSEILSSNGSTSMASVCGSTLALMDAGVPIRAPVSGIAMGLVTGEKGKYIILSDIAGIEDFTGDMDFKVAGTEKGITAVQMDVKSDGLSIDLVKEIVAQAAVGRSFILEKMLAVIGEARKQVSQYAPKIALVHVPVEKIGEIIGPGGKVIRNIIATTGAEVDVEDDGSVSISAPTQEAVDKAVKIIEGLTHQVVVGEEFEGSIKRILSFGAFVEILPGKEGMVHVSQMVAGFVKDPNEVVSIGQKVKVRVVEIDEMGRINLSMLPAGVKPAVQPRSEDRGRARPPYRGGFRRDARRVVQKPFPLDRFRKPSY